MRTPAMEIPDPGPPEAPVHEPGPEVPDPVPPEQPAETPLGPEAPDPQPPEEPDPVGPDVPSPDPRGPETRRSTVASARGRCGRREATSDRFPGHGRGQAENPDPRRRVR